MAIDSPKRLSLILCRPRREALLGVARSVTVGTKGARWYTARERAHRGALIIAMAYDWRTRGRVHPAYLVGSAGLFVGSMRELVGPSERWFPIGRRILAVFV